MHVGCSPAKQSTMSSAFSMPMCESERKPFTAWVSDLNVEERDRPERALVSGFPRQETGTLLERLLIPLIHFVLLGFLPLPAERWSGLKNFATGCGQFLMVRREPYLASGGHSTIRASMHDGLQLPRLFRATAFGPAFMA